MKLSLFHVLFTVGMLLAPALASLFVRAAGHRDVDARRVSRQRTALWVSTGVCVGLFLGLRALGDAGLLGWWARLPRWMTWSERPDQLAWLLFFPLWFGLFMRLLHGARPDLQGAHPSVQDGGQVRSASLTSRQLENPVRPWRWAMAWAAWAAALLFVAASLPGGERPLPALLLLPLGVAAVPLALGPWAVRMLLREPEPLDTRGSQELREAYAAHRRTKIRGMFWMLIAMALLPTSLPVITLSAPETGSAMALAGSIGGSLVGIAGAAFGVRMGLQRLRIKRRLEELIRAEASQ